MTVHQGNLHNQKGDRKFTEQGKPNGNKAPEQARADTKEMAERAATTAKQTLQSGLDAVSNHAREASDRFSRGLGFSGAEGERLADQSKQDMEAVTKCGTVLSQAFQDASRGWFDLAQKQWTRNLDGLNKLTRAKSVQELAAMQSEFAREALQHMVQDSKIIAETALRAVDDAGKAFSGAKQGSPAH
jgi:hypothetical protein